MAFHSLPTQYPFRTQNLNRGIEILEASYKQKAREKITPQVERYATQLGVEYNKTLISDLKYRWGSCTLKGNLKLDADQGPALRDQRKRPVNYTSKL